MARTNWAKHMRSVVKWTCLTLAALFTLYLLYQCLLPLLAFVFPVLDPLIFDLGVFGAYPTQQYVSFRLPGPQVRHPRWDEKCDHGLILLNPNGLSVDRPGPMILDAMGGLIWLEDEFGETANLKVQRYKGQDYLTMWSGQKAATSGQGYYFMLDSSYEVVRVVKAAGEGLSGDLHEFKITPDDTALLTVYNTTSADLTGMGLGRDTDGWIVDNLFQEINLETGELLFQWRASDHFDPIETYMTNPFGGYRESSPFDYYHINSVDKDSQGNYIISSRHFHHVVCISPAGETLWILGGRDNQFADLSDGQATNFKWQHDARWLSEEDGIISLFDNSKAGPLHADASNSRALLIQIDVPNRTAKLVQSLVSLGGILSSSQGSVQFLPETEQIFVGWGSAAAYSEYSRDGALLCETHLGASWFYWRESVKSYRSTKSFGWIGMPKDPPQATIQDDVLYVSWNGATEVAYWALEAPHDQHSVDFENSRSLDVTGIRDEAETAFEMIDIIPKTGFEGSFELSPADSGKLAQYRVAALDSDHKVLRYSDVTEHNAESDESSTLMVLFKLFLVVGFIVGARLIFRYARTAGYLKGFGAGRHHGNSMVPAWYDWTPPASWRSNERTGAIEWIQMRWTAVRSRPRYLPPA